MKNHVSNGQTVNFTAKAKTLPGDIVVLGDALVVIAQDAAAAAGVPCVGRTCGEYSVPCATGLKLGAKVGVSAGALVPADAANAVYFGKLTSDESGGFATALLVP